MKTNNVIIQVLSSRKLKNFKKRRKVFLEIIIFGFLLIFGWYLMEPYSPEDYEYYSIGVSGDGDTQAVGRLNVSYIYWNDTINVEFLLRRQVEEDTKVYLEFPYKVTDSSFGSSYIKNIRYDVFNEGDSLVYIKIPSDNTASVITLNFNGKPALRYNSGTEYLPVSALVEPDMDFPVQFEFHRPAFSNLQIEGPKGDISQYHWRDISDDIDKESSIVFIETPELEKQEQRRVIAGTVLLSIGLSYLVNILYSWSEKKEGTKGLRNKAKPSRRYLRKRNRFR